MHITRVSLWGIIVCCILVPAACAPRQSVQDARVEQSANDAQQRQTEPLITQVVHLRETQALAMQKAVMSMLSVEGTVAVVPQPDRERSRTLMVTDRASVVDTILTTMLPEIDSVSTQAAYLAQQANSAGKTPDLQPVRTKKKEETLFPLAEDIKEIPVQEVGSLAARRTAQAALSGPQPVSGENTTIFEGEGVSSYVYRAKYSSPQELVNTLKRAYGQEVLSTNQSVLLVQLKNAAAAAAKAKEPQVPEVPRFLAVENPQANALMIVATSAQIAEITKLLNMIDARPLQVFLDMAIAEVSLLDEEFFGIQGSLLGQEQITTGGESNSVISLGETVYTAMNPVSPQGFNYVMSVSGRFAARLRALASEDRVKILSDPHIFVVNNATAEIDIGEQIPVKETVISNTGHISEKTRLQQTGISLKVTPRINDAGGIVLDVKQIVKDVGAEN